MVMAYKKQVLKDVSGNTIEFIATSEETGGCFTKIKITLQPQHPQYSQYIQLQQTETLEILSGELTYILNGNVSSARVGETIIVSKGQLHNHFNASATTPLVMIQTIAPSLDFEPFIKTFWGLRQAGERRKLNFWQKMVWLKYLEGPVLFGDMPERLQRFIAQMLAPLAWLMGYRKFYSKYL